MAIDWVFALGISLAGVLMGVMTTFMGIRKGHEPFYWMAFYVVWLVAVAVVRPESPFLTVLVGSVLSGVWTPAIQVSLLDRYRRNNPWYEEELNAIEGSLGLHFFKIGLLLGTLFGVAVGALAWVLVWVLG